MQQPILLELESPLKICGTFSKLIKVTSMDSTQICSGFLITVNSLLKAITFFWVIMSIEVNTHSKRFVFYLPTRSSIQGTFFFSEETTNALQSTEFTDFMTNVRIF
jgi:hypothetical protein